MRSSPEYAVGITERANSRRQYGHVVGIQNKREINLPQAEIVHDRCHISKYLKEAVDKVRREEHKQLKAKEDDRLTGMRNLLLLFNPENLREEKITSFPRF